jgi:integrase
MRLQEILGLKWEMVHLWDTGGEIELIYTKSGKKRCVPINSTVRQVFESLDQKDEYVFIGTKGKPLKSSRKPMARTFRKAKVDYATFHDFRHSWASWMSDAGVDPYTIMEIGGWADMKTRLRYLHRTRANRQNAVEKISSALSSHLSATSAKIHEMSSSVSSLKT